MTDSNNVATSNKATFSISIERGAIVIKDADKKGGGNLLTNGGKWVSWRNETGGTCRLAFRKLLGEGEAGDGEAAWPFDSDTDPPDAELEIPKETTDDKNLWRGKLKSVRELTCFEYKVRVEMDDGRTYDLDPVIIVRR